MLLDSFEFVDLSSIQVASNWPNSTLGFLALRGGRSERRNQECGQHFITGECRFYTGDASDPVAARGKTIRQVRG